MDLRGRPILITGASSGIGRATAIACARAGMPVGVMARRAEAIEATAASVRTEGVEAFAFAGDVTDVGACEAFVSKAAEALGPVYGVFANAGYGAETPTWSMDDEAMRRMFEANVWGAMNVVRPALPGLRDRGSGHLLLCSSCLSKIGLPMYGSYTATKACLDHFARAMRHELRASGVHVSSVHPIGTKTEFFDTAERHSGHESSLRPRRSSVGMQPAERVADAVVACLRRPRGEVWTSVATRLTFAAAVAAPGLADLAIRRVMKRRLSPQSP